MALISANNSIFSFSVFEIHQFEKATEFGYFEDLGQSNNWGDLANLGNLGNLGYLGNFTPGSSRNT